MEIEITCQGNLGEFGDIKSKLEDYEEVENVELRGISKLSADAMSSTIITISALSLTVGLAQFIYNIIQDCKQKNNKHEIKVNQQIVNINSNDSQEEIQLKLNIENKQ